MKIWLTQIGEALPIGGSVRKMRAALLADKLTARGHAVIWWAGAFDHGKKKMLFEKDTEIRIDENLVIKALRGMHYRRNFSARRYVDHKLIGNKFKKLAIAEGVPDIIVASMPDYFTAYEAVRYAQKHSIPVLIDIRDQWPDLFLDALPTKLKPFARCLLFSDFRKVKYLLRNADGIVSMMKEILDWGLNRAAREATWKDKVFYLGASRVSLRPGKAVLEKFAYISEHVRGKFVAIFIGTFGKYYNPLTIVQAAKFLDEDATKKGEIFFIIAGDGKYSDIAKNAAKGLKNVFFPGWVDQDEASYLLTISSVGIIPCNEPIYAFPNKAFAYLSVGLPIISSVEGDLKEIIQKYKIGFYYKGNDYQELARLIKEIMEKSDLRVQMAKNSALVFDCMFDADKIYEEYAIHVEKMALSKP